MTRVLYVDDDQASRDILMRFLRHLNMEVDTVETAQAAISQAQDTVYDLIVLDLRLPDMDGWELLNHIKASATNALTKVAALTAYYDASVAQHARQAGFANCFAKPANMQIAQELQSLLTA